MKKIFATCFFTLYILFMIGIYAYAETVSISGKITQFSSTGLSLNDIIISVTGTKTAQVKTGRTGSYIVSGLPKGGTYTVTASKPGYTFQPANKIYRNLDESKVSQDFVAELATYSISGRVIVGGKPVRGVLITINNRPIKYYTDQDGAYVIDNLESNGGPYEVTVVSDKHFFEPFKIESLEENVVHDFRKDISVNGRVTSLGIGVAGIEVDVNGVKYKTDDDGYYKVTSIVSNGDYVVRIAEEKFNPVPASIPLKKVTSDKYDVNFAVSGQLIGKVTYNGQPFKNAIVTVSDREKEYKTNAQGMFNVPNLGLNQYYQISLSSEGYKFTPKERVINCLMRESSYQNFKAEIEKHSITVSANQGKQALENVEIVVNNKTTVHKTDKNGVCVIKDLPYGKKYTLTAKKQGIVFVDSKKVIDKLQEDERISFETKLSISGKVLDNSKPLKDAVITCGDKKVKTNAKGEYILKDLVPSKDYTIKVSSTNFVFAKEEIEITNLYDKLEDVNFVVSAEKKEEKETAGKVAANVETETKNLKDTDKTKKAEAEKNTKEEKARLAAEAKAKAEAEKQAKLEAAKAAKEEQARIKAEKEEAARKAKEEKIRAKLEAEELARKAKEEKARLAAEAKAKAEAEKQAKLKEAEEAKAKAEADKKAKEEKERLAAEAKAKLEAEKQAKIEAEKKAKEEKERLAAEAKAKAEAEKQAKLEAAKAAKEEQARIKAEKEEAARKAKEEKIRAKLEAEEAAKKAKEEKARLAAEAKAKAEADKKAKEEQAKLDAEIKKLELQEKAKAEL
nr:carboxypeptidase regulatory-like domain-containing protein [Endomicrobiaceae bacterium]